VATAPGRVEIALPHRRAGHCGSGALRDLLEFHGLSWGAEPLSEGMVFGLGAGLGFAYVELPGMDPPLYLVGRTGALERDVCANLGIDLDLRQTDDPAEGWRVLREALDAGEPTMVWADIRHLEYLRVRLQMTMHDIVITGYDETEGVAFVADNDRDEIQRCSLAALARARNSDGFPRPNRHGTWLMDFPARLPHPKETVRRAIVAAVANMHTGGESLEAPSDALGLAGAATLAAGFAGWPDRFGDRLPAALRGLHVFVVKAGTGGALFRSLHARFLQDAAELLDDAGLRAAGAIYDELAGAWVAAAEAAGADDTPERAHAAAAPHVARAAELEAAGVAAMERWLD
jgi:hypothetical protein